MQATTVEDGRGISGLLAIICGSVSTGGTYSSWQVQLSLLGGQGRGWSARVSWMGSWGGHACTYILTDPLNFSVSRFLEL